MLQILAPFVKNVQKPAVPHELLAHRSQLMITVLMATLRNPAMDAVNIPSDRGPYKYPTPCVLKNINARL